MNLHRNPLLSLSLILFVLIGSSSKYMSQASADPCGLVPPISIDPRQTFQVVRTGVQRTYAFHRRGVETIVIRPAFEGDVREFGMLIPFPSPPAIRKVADDVFQHLTHAIDPPEVVVDLTPKPIPGFGAGAGMGGFGGFGGGLGGFIPGLELQAKEVKLVREEAVGMYEVAVLAAGSAGALRRWMRDHKYRFPTGMGPVVDEYIAEGWGFVAVKTKVAGKTQLDPKPGQRVVSTNLAPGAKFTGAVQAMGFRFRTRELVIPMRLSVFNGDDLRNVVYLLTDKPVRIVDVPKAFVRRQISGAKLLKNLTEPLPLRIIGGKLKDVPRATLKTLKSERDPFPRMAIAKELIGTDLMASGIGQLDLPHDETTKGLEAIDEFFSLTMLDVLHRAELPALHRRKLDRYVRPLKEMTLTVIDGDFPREVLKRQNLLVEEFKLNAGLNRPARFGGANSGSRPDDAPVAVVEHATASATELFASHQAEASDLAHVPHAAQMDDAGLSAKDAIWFVCGAIATISCLPRRRRRRGMTIVVLAVSGVALLLIRPATAWQEPNELASLVRQLGSRTTASQGIETLLQSAAKGASERSRVVKALADLAERGTDTQSRGWALVALTKLGGSDVDEIFTRIHTDKRNSELVRLWAAAGRMKLCDRMESLQRLDNLLVTFPLLNSTFASQTLHFLRNEGAGPERMLKLSLANRQIESALGNQIVMMDSDKLVRVMLTDDDQAVRRQAAAFLGALAQRQPTKVAESVVAQLALDVKALHVPWNGGALFIPGIEWSEHAEHAQMLVERLIAWHVWCDVQGLSAEQSKIGLNLTSFKLTAAAKYAPVRQQATSLELLETWVKAAGRQRVEAMLRVQGLMDNPAYNRALK